MTRKEKIVSELGLNKIVQESIKRHPRFADKRVGFIDGAEWMQSIMIEKARQWFNLHFRQVGTPKEIKHDFQSKEKMWKSFTQFMEE